MKTPIIDLHTAIQGEGALAGTPHILIRTSGCNLRCIFGNSKCDTPYSSFSPEKSRYDFQDIETLVNEQPQIRHILLTGGEPCLHPEFIEKVLKDYGHHFVTIETNGTIFPSGALAEQVDLVSISPKLSSSVPSEAKAKSASVKYSETAELKHRELIFNLAPILEWIVFAQGFQLKYVINDESDIEEVIDQIRCLRIHTDVLNSRIYLMPAGTTNEQLQGKRQWLMERCLDLGFNYTDRLQILAYGDKRGV